MDSRRLTTLFVAFILLGCAAGVAVPAGLGWDFANFYDAGRRLVAGQSGDLYHPLNPIAGQPPQGSTGFFGSPLSAVLYAPMAPLSPEAALVAFKLANVAAFLATFVLLHRFHLAFVDQTERDRFTAWFAGLCLVFQPFWTVFRVGGQTTPFGLLLIAIALVAHTRARFWLSSVCVVSAMLIKPGWAPILLFLLLVSGSPFLWRTMAVLAVSGVVSLAMFGIAVHRDFVSLMLENGSRVYPWYYNSSLAILVDNVRLWLQSGAVWPASLQVFSVIIYAMQLALLGVIVALTVRGHREIRETAARRHFDTVVAILLFAFWSRTLWEHYLALLFVPLGFLLANRPALSRPAWRVVLGVFALSLFQNLIFTNWLRTLVGTESLAWLVGASLLKAGPLLLMLVLVTRYRADLLRCYGAWPTRPAGAPATS